MILTAENEQSGGHRVAEYRVQLGWIKTESNIEWRKNKSLYPMIGKQVWEK